MSGTDRKDSQRLVSNFFVKLQEVLNLCPITFHGKWEHLPSRQEVIIPHGNERCLDIILILWQQDFWTQTSSQDESTKPPCLGLCWARTFQEPPIPATLYIPLNYNSINFPLILSLMLRIQISKPANASVAEKKPYVEKPKREKRLKKFNLCRLFHACTSSGFWFWTDPSPHQLVTPWQKWLTMNSGSPRYGSSCWSSNWQFINLT